MLGFLDMLPFIAGVGHTVSKDVSTKAIRSFVLRHGQVLNESDQKEVFKLDRSKFTDFSRLNQQRKNVTQLGSQIPKMMILGVISSFEHHIASFINIILDNRPELLNSKNIEMTLKEISLFDSIDDLRAYYIESQVQTIMRDSFEKQISTIEKYLGIKRPIKDDYERWADLIELFERRNLFAHANGVVNKIYLNNTGRVDVVIGERLGVSSGYFSNSIENLFEFGMKMIVLAWRRECKSDVSLIDEEFGSFCYSLMESRYYKLGARLLEFADSSGVSDDRQKKMNKINLANCYRLSGDDKRSKSVIKSVDWGAAADEFKVCVASINGDLDAVLAFIKSIPTSKLDPEVYENWPAFYKLRDDPAFSSAFEETFGRPFVPAGENRRSFSELMALVREDEDKSTAQDGQSGQVIEGTSREAALDK